MVPILDGRVRDVLPTHNIGWLHVHITCMRKLHQGRNGCFKTCCMNPSESRGWYMDWTCGQGRSRRHPFIAAGVGVGRTPAAQPLPSHGVDIEGDLELHQCLPYGQPEQEANISHGRMKWQLFNGNQYQKNN